MDRSKLPLLVVLLLVLPTLAVLWVRDPTGVRGVVSPNGSAGIEDEAAGSGGDGSVSTLDERLNGTGEPSEGGGTRAGRGSRSSVGLGPPRRLRGRLDLGEGMSLAAGESLSYSIEQNTGWQRIPVRESGFFELNVPNDCESVEFRLTSDCRRLEQSGALDVGEFEGTLELALADSSALEVHVRFPGGRPLGSGMPEGSKAELVVDSFGEDRRWTLTPRDDPGLGFEGAGIPPLETAEVRVHIPGFVPMLRRNVRLFACETSEVEFLLEVGAEVTGRVLGDGGGPVVGARVLAQTIDPALMSREVVHTEEGTTDAFGTFHFQNLRPATTRIRVEHEGALPTSVDLGPLENGSSLDGVELVLVPGGWIEGRVVDAEGAPGTGVEVELQHGASRGNPREQKVVDGDGGFRFESLGSGPWTVVARSGEDESLRVGVEHGIEVGRGDVEVRLIGGSHLDGLVVDDRGEALEDFRAKVTPIDSGRPGDLGRSGRNERFRKSGGSFRIDGLHGGLWEVTASARGHSAGHPVRVSLPSTTPARIVLAREGGIAGRVQRPDGRPLAGARVTATLEGARSPGARDVTDEEGRFHLDGLAAGAQRLTAAAEGWAESNSEVHDLAPGEERKGIALVVGVGARLTGEVQGPDSDRRHRSILARPAGDWTGPKTTTDGEGRFEFEALAPGDWIVSFDYQQPSGSDEDWVAAYQARRDQRVVLREGETTHVVLGGDRPGHVRFRGRVLEGGEPAPNMIAYAWQDPHGINHLAGIARSDADGGFELSIPASTDYHFTVGLDQLSQARFELAVGNTDMEYTFVMPTGGLRGRAIDLGGRPMAGTALMLVEASRESGTLELGSLRRASTDAEGRFEFKALQPGTYVLRSGGFGSSAGASGIAVEVLEGLAVQGDRVTDGVELRIRPPGSIQGTVISAEGRPLAGIALRVETSGGRDIFAWSPPRTDFAGGFVLNGIAPGSWTVVAVHHDGREVHAEVEVRAHGVSPLTLEFP